MNEQITGLVRRQPKTDEATTVATAAAKGAAVPVSASPRAIHRFSALRVHPQIQSKITVGAVDDPTEREAETLARRVMSMAEPDAAGPEAVAASEDAMFASVPITDAANAEGKNGLAWRAARAVDADFNGTEDVSATVNAALSAGGGTGLDDKTRSFMEQRFGYDLSQVRLHHGPVAARSARDLKSHAYTFGADIVFADGQYRPGTSDGNHLLAHELTHVIQQGGAKPLNSPAEK